MTGWMWILPTVIGVALLGVALAYGIRQTRRHIRDPDAVRRTERATAELYKKPDDQGPSS